MAGEYDSDYTVLNIDLAPLAGKQRNEILQSGKPVAAVSIIQLPAGAVGNIFLRFGEAGDGIPLRQEALTIGRNPARSTGLYLDVNGGVVGILILMIGIDLNVNA